jgi:GR25 family glycosyltransferase involved in LPS biosynthesis
MITKYLLFGFLVLLFIYILSYTTKPGLENFDNNININSYVITLKTEDRLTNIKKQKLKLKTDITLFDAVVGDKLDLDDLIQKGIVSDYYKNSDKPKKREVGCHMSHLSLYKKIKESNVPGCTLVLEDDFVVKDDNNMDKIKECINKINNKGEDFDMLFLGNFKNNHGENVIDNIYKDDKNELLLCTHAYIINNSHIDKIMDLTTRIDGPIDHKLNLLSKTDALKLLTLYPTMIDQGGGPTLINNVDIELFKNYH